MNKSLLLIFIGCLWSVMALAAITVQVEPDKVQLGDTIRLILMTDDAQSTGVPDLTPLQKDFRIVGTERSMNYTFINGQSRATSRWTVLLIAKKVGVLSIPPLQVGHQQSKAMRVEVLDDASTVTSSDTKPLAATQEEVVLKTEVSENNPYVSQQVIYTVRLYNSGRLLDAEYQPPKAENALLIALGDADRYQTVEHGRAYMVEEQRYAVFPQKSGTVRIIGPSFHALSYDTIPRQINQRSQVTTLTVKPVPPNFNNRLWLPAKQVTLAEQYDKDVATMSEGDTLVRTVTLQAAAVPGQLLPTLDFAGSQYSVYPEKPQVNNVIRQQELIGEATTKVTYLLNKPGHVTIPRLELPWFNTMTGKEEVAVLPERTINITAKYAASQQPETPNAVVSIKSNDLSSQSQEKMTFPSRTEKSNNIAWWLAAGFAAIWVMTLIIWWYRSKLLKNHDKRLVLKRLHKACIYNNPYEARDALLHWARLQWPGFEFLNLRDLTKRIHDSQFKKQLHLLSQILYSPDKKIPWQGKELWQCIVAYRKGKVSKDNKTGDLPPINPL
ncbi:BatD family protein [Legionella nagasakiensis]|uniref:BatD family protein n=1 Tax=Legionella nagasakiensis TaxID=535290 RepID=UPI0013EFB27B|nr:BatD family protein [Legionella nagasakiensis]